MDDLPTSHVFSIAFCSRFTPKWPVATTRWPQREPRPVPPEPEVRISARRPAPYRRPGFSTRTIPRTCPVQTRGCLCTDPDLLVCSSTPSGSHGERFLDAAVFSPTSISHPGASISPSHAFRRRSTPRTQYSSSEPSGCDTRQERRLLLKGIPLAGFQNRGNLPGQTRDRVGRGCPDNIPVGVDPLPWTIERFRI